MAGSSHACSTRLCPYAGPTFSLRSGTAPLRMDCAGRSKDPPFPECRLKLALPCVHQPVREWVRDPANSSEPPKRPPNFAKHQVIYASRVPQLSGPALLEKHRLDRSRTVAAAVAVERSGFVVGRPAAPAQFRRGIGASRSLRWQILLLAAIVLSISTPVF